MIKKGARAKHNKSIFSINGTFCSTVLDIGKQIACDQNKNPFFLVFKNSDVQSAMAKSIPLADYGKDPKILLIIPISSTYFGPRKIGKINCFEIPLYMYLYSFIKISQPISKLR